MSPFGKCILLSCTARNNKRVQINYNYNIHYTSFTCVHFHVHAFVFVYIYISLFTYTHERLPYLCFKALTCVRACACLRVYRIAV